MEIEKTYHLSSNQSDVVQRALYRLSCEWKIDPDKMFGKREQLEKLCAEVGTERFNVAISGAIENWKGDFCPTTAQIRQYVPSEKSGPTGFVPTVQDFEDRRLHPENYWGEHDLVCMMRAQAKRMAENKPLYTLPQIEQVILKARQKYGSKYRERFVPASQPKRNSSSYEMTEADYL